MISYTDSVQFLYSLGNEIKTIKLGLERISKILAAMGNPHLAFEVVHVAGTNGKGSVCSMIESGLRVWGKRTGLFTSPHLIEPTERIRISGEAVSSSEFALSFGRVHGVAEQLLETGEIDAHPTYFETVTAMAFDLFRERGVEIAVVEVGLGGRLDSTNVVRPKLAVITPVDFDHEAWLGFSIEAIAGEKAGILKRGVPAVIARQRSEAWGVIHGIADSLGVAAERTKSWHVLDLALHARGCRYVASRQQSYSIDCPLAGEHQVENSLTACAALHKLGLPQSAVEDGIAKAHWPGRLDLVSSTPEVIIDGAHNPAGVRALASYISRFYTDRKVWLIYGTMRDKSFGEIGEVLGPLANELILTAPDSARSLRPEALADAFDHPRLHVTQNLSEALTVTGAAAPNDVIFITGSLVLAGEALRRFRETGAAT